MKSPISVLALAAAALLLTGCATYLPPGSRADLQALAAPAIQEAFATAPANPFPASIAAVRVQGPNYSNHHLRQAGGAYGTGAFTVVLVREVEDPSLFDRLAGLHAVTGLVGLNRMLLPTKLDSESDLRRAAARLHADLVFVYTFDTTFVDTDAAKPLSVITLGLSPTRKITAITTVSALLLDTRTGYVYAAFESTEQARTLASSWGSADAADGVRRKTERDAFTKLIGEFESAWPRIVSRAKAPEAAAPPPVARTG